MDRPRRRLRCISLTFLVAALGAAAWLAAFGGPPEPVGASVRGSWPSPEHDLRRIVLAERDAALARGDLVGAAEIHADLAQEAVLRARAVHDAWMTLRDTRTGLFPRGVEDHRWLYRDTAADWFGFQLHAALYTDAPTVPLLRETLRAERALAGPDRLCGSVDARTGADLGESARRRMFGSCEYIKDGLISVFERRGDEEVLARMVEVADAVVRYSAHESRFGRIPARDSEVNGDMLQVLSRLAFLRPDAARDAMAARLADAACLQMLAAAHGLPVREFDYERDRAVQGVVQLRDHGNEVAVGLSEAYALAVARSSDPEWRARADRWAGPIARMFELILERGRNSDGLIANELDPETLRLIDGEPSDNWGYVLCGALLFLQAAERHGVLESARRDRMLAFVDGVAHAVAETDGVAWEGSEPDGYADSLESAIYVAAYRRDTGARLLPWLDDQIGTLFSWQRPDGFVEKGYLDGNFIRTCLLYADMRSGGWRLDPWSPHARVGMAWGADGEAVLVVRADSPYTGTLRADSHRHREFLRLPWDWPRINSWPEWAPRQSIVHMVVPDGSAAGLSVADLPNGVPVHLEPGHRLVLRLRLAPGGTGATGHGS